MAKKEKEDALGTVGSLDRSIEEEGKGSKIVSILIGLIILVFILGAIAVCIKLDLGGVGSNVLRPILKDVPVLNAILPSVSDEELALENAYDYDNLSDAVARIKELEAQVKNLEEKKKQDEATITDLTNEVTRLTPYEESQKEFSERVKEFDENVVFNEKAPDIEAYKEFYEGINSANAAEIYQQVVEQLAIDQKVVLQGERYSKMEPANAASILEIMTSDLDLVAQILESMKTTNASAILAEMDPNFAAKITKKMAIME